MYHSYMASMLESICLLNFFFLGGGGGEGGNQYDYYDLCPSQFVKGKVEKHGP